MDGEPASAEWWKNQLVPDLIDADSNFSSLFSTPDILDIESGVSYDMTKIFDVDSDNAQELEPGWSSETHEK